MLIFIQQKIITKLDEDSVFRMKCAIAMNITERGVYNIVKRYIEQPSGNCNLTKLAAIKFFQSEGFNDDEIFYSKEPAV